MPVTIKNWELKDEHDFREALIRTNAELRKFRERSNPQTRTPELWERFWSLQANAVWLEDSLAAMQRARTKRTGGRSGRKSIREKYGKSED